MRASSLPIRGDGGRRWLPRLRICRRSQGRSMRHHVVNDILWRALTKAEIPSTREPTELFRADGKRQDGATLVPWERGKYLAWDATIVHTCATSYITHQSGKGESAAVQAANRKTLKYEGLPLSRGIRSP